MYKAEDEYIIAERIKIANGCVGRRYNWPTPVSTVHLEKLTAPHLVKKSPHFMEPEGASPCSQEPATYVSPEPH